MKDKISVEFTKDKILDILKTYVEDEIGLKCNDFTKFDVKIEDKSNYFEDYLGTELVGIEIKGLEIGEKDNEL